MILDVINELLGDLDTITAAGRNFTMEKVVGLLRQEFGVAAPALSAPQRRAVRRALDDLGDEQRRMLPDPDRFVVRAHVITETLALV